MRSTLRALAALVLLWSAAPAHAVQPVFDPNGASFYDLPFPHELRRDPDGTVALSTFPFPVSPLIAAYAASLEEVPGFGLNSGVFLKFDGDIDPVSLPADADASRLPGASVFLINIDPGSPARGARTPLWFEFRSVGDAYRDNHLLGAMPVPGHPLQPDTLYALVLTNALLGADMLPVSAPPLIVRMQAETPLGPFEQAALPLYRGLWKHLEQRESLPRADVVAATIFRTYRPADGMFATERLIRKQYRKLTATTVAFSNGAPNYWKFTGQFSAPQFQTGTPPFSTAGSGQFTFDAKGAPIVEREESLHFVLAVPKHTDDGTIKMPSGGWPVVAYMHGTGGSRNSFINEDVSGILASVGIASIGIDQPLHGLRLGATPDGSNFYNPLNPYALRDNPRQAAADSLSVHQLLANLRVDPALIVGAPGPGYVPTTKRIAFKRSRRLFMGHSQGATTGPLFLAVGRKVRGGVISAGGGHIIINILTREEGFFMGLKLRDLVELLLGGPVDLFHPALHLLQMGSDLSDPVTFAPYFATERRGRPLSLLFTHGILDGYVTTPMTAAMVSAARYPLIAPTFPPMAFPLLPGYSYQETFDLAALPTLATPVSGNLGQGKRRGTGGMLLFENDGHFPVFDNPTAIVQYQEFMRTLAYDDPPTIPSP